jgi:hypothetical protein
VAGVEAETARRAARTKQSVSTLPGPQSVDSDADAAREVTDLDQPYLRTFSGIDGSNLLTANVDVVSIVCLRYV